MDNYNLGKPIGALSGHTVPLNGFDQGEHGSGTGLAGGHVPSATNQAKGYGQDHSSGFNSGLGGEHASGGLPGQNQQRTPIADKFMGSSSDNTVSGAYESGGTGNALTGSTPAHTTGPGVGPYGENLSGQQSSHSARDAVGSAGAAGAIGAGSHSHGQSGTGVGVGALGGSGGHYSTEGQHGTSSLSGNNTSSSLSGSNNNSNIGHSNSAGVLGAQQAGARDTHGSSGLAGVGAGAVGAGALGAGAATHSSHSHNNDKSGIRSDSKQIDSDNSRGEPLSNPKDLDSGSRHGLVFDKATGKYEHRHVVEGDRDDRK